jgi:hypothetical protein
MVSNRMQRVAAGLALCPLVAQAFLPAQQAAFTRCPAQRRAAAWTDGGFGAAAANSRLTSMASSSQPDDR